MTFMTHFPKTERKKGHDIQCKVFKRRVVPCTTFKTTSKLIYLKAKNVEIA